jgi:hypothetical protein
MKLLFKSILMPLFLVSLAVADGASIEATSADSETAKRKVMPVDQSSENFKKTEDFLPGEEVVSTTGKKVKVWSTKGPVPVSRAPEPFEDRDKTVLDGSHLVIDAEELRRKRKEQRDAAKKTAEDSFDLRE